MQQAGALVFPCRRCGQPRSIPVRDFYAPPCPACGDASPPPADVAKAIQAARAAELNLPFALMQVGATRETPIYERSSMVFWWSIPAVLMAIPMVIAWRSIIWAYADNARIEEFVYEVLLQLPLPAHVVIGVVLWRKNEAIRRARRAVAQQRPADHVAMVCRFCGGPIESRSLDETVVTCPHCNRQNIMDAAALAARATNEVAAFERMLGPGRAPDRAIAFFGPLLFTVFVLILIYLRLWDGRL